MQREKVAVSDWDLNAGNAFAKETSLGDFATDAIYWQVSQAVQSAPDAVIINGGALRKSIKAGEIRLRDIYDVIPFGNQLCTIEVTGAQLLEALEAATYAAPEPKGAFPQVSQIKFTLDTTVPYQTGDRYPDSVYYAPAAPGSRVTITEVGGKAFDPEAVYTIATIDFVASGGDTYYCFAQAGAKTKTYVGYLDFDALANYMKTGLEGTIPEIYAEPQGRITIIETARQTPADHSRPRDLISGVGHCLGSVTLLFELGLLDGKCVVLLRDLGLCRDARVVGGLVGFCLRDPGLSDLAHCVTDDQF